MSAFCYSLYDDIAERRTKHRYVDECCISPSESDDENDIEAPRQNQVQQNRTNLSQNLPTVRYTRTDNNDGSTEDNDNPNDDESLSKRTELSTIEIMPKIESKNPSTVKKNRIFLFLFYIYFLDIC